MPDTFTIKTAISGEVLSAQIKTIPCTCTKSKPAKKFKELVELVKQAEDVLIENGYDDMDDRIGIIRGIYYGTTWSLDWENEQSTARNTAFNVPYTGSLTPPDAREALKCSKNCVADLYNSLYDTYEVFDNPYKAVDFGHLIIGMHARTSLRARSLPIPTQGGSGLEITTWVGDLGGGVGNLSLKRVKTPTKRAVTLFPRGKNFHSYGAMVNLEGDIAAYVVGMDKNKESKIDNPTNNFKTIHEALKDFFEDKWNKRALYFLKMLGGKFESDNSLKNRDELIEYCANAFSSFAYWYMGLRMPEQGMGGVDEFAEASNHFVPVSKEVASIFIDGLIHVVDKPQDMITRRTNPDPLPPEKSHLAKPKIP